MDDLRDADLIQLEDAENNNDSENASSEDESVEDILAAEEAMMISETLKFEESDLESSDDSDDDDQTPKTSFQARLDRLRKQSQSRKHLNTSIDSIEGMENDSDEEKTMFCTET